MALQTGLLLLLKHKITLIYLLLFIRFITRCYSLSLIVILCYSLSFVVTSCTTRCNSLYLIGEKSRGKVSKFFPGFLFPDQYFSPIFFHLTMNLSRFFLSRIIIIISNLFAKFIITIFFMYFKHFQRYTNADLKISLYVLIHIKIIS